MWEGSSVIAEYDNTGALEVEYVYAGGRMIAREQGTNRVYSLYDRLSVRATITDGGSGGIVGRQGHLPFGEEIGGSGTTDKHKFTSYERDSESGTDYAINRQYSYSAGRFLRVDPKASSARLDAPQSWNRYSYVHNEPVNQTDPLGLDIPGPGPRPGEPPHPPGPDPRFDHEHGPCPAWQHSCDDSPGFSLGFTISPGSFLGGGIGEMASGSPFSFQFPSLEPAGYLTVDVNCGNSVLYVPDGVVTLRDRPEKSWRDATGVHRVKADFVATARGVVKIRGLCDCRVSCTGGDDYKITCTCPTQEYGIHPWVLSDADLSRQGLVADPRIAPQWRWVDERDHYDQDYIYPNQWIFD